MNRPVLIITAGVLVVLVAIGVNYALWQQEVTEEPTIATTTEPRATPAPEPKVEPTPSPAQAPAATPAPTAETPPESEPEPAATASQPAPTGTVTTAKQPALGDKQTASLPAPAATEQGMRRPSFDVVRVSPEGETVMAGRAEPGKKTKIIDRGKVIGEVVADQRGEWVFIPDEPLPSGNSEITLETETEDGKPVESDSAVVLVVPEHGQDIAGRPTETPQQPLILKVQRDDPTTGRPIGDRRASVVLQGPNEARGTPVAGLAVDAVDYDPEGRLSISGRAKDGTTVQLYLSNRFLGRTAASGEGAWSLVPEGTVEPGIYTLRADQIDAKGRVTARVELPFSRAEPLPLGPGRFIIVQPGNSLWRIARRTYGTGFAFTTIYEANAGQIADPDLIYPGQIFQLPAAQ